MKIIILILLGFIWSVSLCALPINSTTTSNTLQTPYPILFIHGIAGGFQDWQPMINKLSSSSFKMGVFYEDELFHNYTNTPPKDNIWLWNITYYTPNPAIESLTGNLTLYTTRLQQMISSILSITNTQKVILIAHSMGSLIAQNYMVQSQKNWDTVHKVVTIGAPFYGVGASIGIVGQLKDLRPNSTFLTLLHKKWDQFYSLTNKKWGVIGAIDTQLHKNTPPFLETHTDGGGPGYIKLSSSIPFDEWDEAFNSHFLRPSYQTTHFGFRQAIIGHHKYLMNHPAVLEAIRWSVKK